MKKVTWIIVSIVGFIGLSLLALIIGFAIQRQGAVTGSSFDDGGYGTTALGSFGEVDLAFEEEFVERSAAPISNGTAGQTAADVDQKIIKTGSLDLVVDEVPDAVASITNIATSVGGFVQRSSVNETPDGVRFGSVTIRVPSKDFESSMAEVKSLATLVENESASGRDVTEEFTDLQARLKNAQAQEEAYIRVLDQAVTVKDILAVQEKLGTIRSQIESLEGRIQYLENVTSFSTITVSLSEEVSITLPTDEFRPLASIKEAAQALVAIGQTVIVGLIWIVIVGGGIVIPIGLIVWGIVRAVKYARRGKKK